MRAKIERPEMSHHERNATGDHLDTGGRLAVVKLADISSELIVQEKECHLQSGATAP
jgi:hypothetical protein